MAAQWAFQEKYANLTNEPGTSIVKKVKTQFLTVEQAASEICYFCGLGND